MLRLSQQSDQQTWRALVLRQNGTEVLLAGGGPRFALPAITIPRGRRVAKEMVQAMKTDWGCEAICVSMPGASFPASNGETVSYQLLEFWNDTNTNSDRAEWVPVAYLSRDYFQDAQDYCALQQSLAESAECAVSSSGPFARLGWFKELRAWVAGTIGLQGLKLQRSFCQWNASPTFGLIRFETSGLAVWFKAVGEPNVRELPITSELARLCPDSIPQIIAVRRKWNAWLAWEAEGTTLGESGHIEHWKSAATALADIQIATCGHSSNLIRSGARDLRLSVVSNLVHPFLGIVAELMDQQPKFPPQILNRHELRYLEDQIKRTLASAGDLRIPDSVGHLDLNPGNIIVSAHSCVLVDWAEAYVGFPFLSFEYLLEHFRQTNAEPEREAELIDSYWRPWTLSIPADRLSAAKDCAPLLAVFAYATQSPGWEKHETNAGTASYLRSLTRRMKREADRLPVH